MPRPSDFLELHDADGKAVYVRIDRIDAFAVGSDRYYPHLLVNGKIYELPKDEIQKAKDVIRR